MRRVLPSDAVVLIERQFPWVVAGSSPSGVSYANGASLAGLTDVVDQIPDSLLSFSSEQPRDFLFAISSLGIWSTDSLNAQFRKPLPIGPFSGNGDGVGAMQHEGLSQPLRCYLIAPNCRRRAAASQ